MQLAWQTAFVHSNPSPSPPSQTPLLLVLLSLHSQTCCLLFIFPGSAHLLQLCQSVRGKHITVGEAGEIPHHANHNQMLHFPSKFLLFPLFSSLFCSCPLLFSPFSWKRFDRIQLNSSRFGEILQLVYYLNNYFKLTVPEFNIFLHNWHWKTAFSLTFFFLTISKDLFLCPFFFAQLILPPYSSSYFKGT